MKHLLPVLALILSLVAIFAAFHFSSPKSTAVAETGFDRMMRTGVLRCGYQYWDGGLMKNEDTGAMEGFIVDVVERIGKNADVKIEWIGPIDWGQIPAELQAGKIDAWCAATWLDTRRSKFMLMSDAVAYNGFEAFVRIDDARFDANPAALNDPSVRLAIIDNTSSGIISHRLLPKATVYSLPTTATDMDLLLNVSTGKADVAFTAPGIAHPFMANNPGKVKRLRPNQPYAEMAAVFTVGLDDQKLVNFLNTALRDLRNTGEIGRLIDIYNKRYPDFFLVK